MEITCEIVAVIGYYCIWFTPIIFILSLIGVMKSIKEGKETSGYTKACCISFIMIVIPMYCALMLIDIR